MLPLARFLIRHGIDYTAFAEQSRWAFVHAAAMDSGERGRAASVARVSAITGIGRREVTRLRATVDEDASDLAAWWRRLGDILQRWHTEADYIDSHGNPIDLSTEEGGGFDTLVKRYGGEMSSSFVLRELRRLRSVQDLSNGRIRVVGRPLVPRGGDAESLHHFGETLANVAATMLHNFDADRTDPPYLEKFVWADGLSEGARIRFRRICADQGYKFLEAMDDWLSTNCDPALVADSENLSLGVGVYYFEKSRETSGPSEVAGNDEQPASSK
jgi:Family of unknown function (DUF6502)